MPRVFVYSYKASDKGSLVEYAGDLAVKDLKTFCQDHLPRFSKRVDLKSFEFSGVTLEKLPTVILLSTKKDTPVIWRVLSGLYRKRIIFYDVEVCCDSAVDILLMPFLNLFNMRTLMTLGFQRVITCAFLMDLIFLLYYSV